MIIIGVPASASLFTPKGVLNFGTSRYYNLELPDHENMVVAGVTVESQYPIRRVTVTMAEFREMLVAKYGRLTPAILVSVQKKVRFLTDGRVVVPVDKRVA